MLPYILLVAGFVILIKWADFLVDGATSISRRFNLSDLVIGLTVVAFGTSSPELFVNLAAGIQGNTDIAIGNILGSNIANILLILGVSSVIHPLSVCIPAKSNSWTDGKAQSLFSSMLLTSPLASCRHSYSIRFNRASHQP